MYLYKRAVPRRLADWNNYSTLATNDLSNTIKCHYITIYHPHYISTEEVGIYYLNPSRTFIITFMDIFA